MLKGTGVIPHAIAVLNMKGGVGKTSLVANIAGLVAAAEQGSGSRVLAVDLDTQGSLGRDLGYYDQDGRDDKGAALFAAATTGILLRPLRDVRPGLDVIPGGPRLEDLAAVVGAQQARSRASAEQVVSNALAGVAADYDLVLIDCPPGNRLLIDVALSAAHYVLIPTKTDDASLDGLAFVAERFAAVSATSNPDLQLLGVSLFGVGRGSTRILKRAREAVAADLGDSDLIFTSSIRHVEAVAQDARRRGQLVHELEVDALNASTWWERKKLGPAAAPDDSPSRSAIGLAEDYQNLTVELLDRLQAAAPTSAASL